MNSINADQLAFAWIGFRLPRKPEVSENFSRDRVIVRYDHRRIILECSDMYSGVFSYVSIQDLPKDLQDYLKASVNIITEGQSIARILNEDKYPMNCTAIARKIFPTYRFSISKPYDLTLRPSITYDPIRPVPPAILLEWLTILSLRGVSRDLVRSGREWNRFFSK